MLIGCHTSIRESVSKAPKRASDSGCEVMQIFSRPPQGGKGAEITPELQKEFRSECKKNNIKEIYIHTPYYINLASNNNRIRYGSIKAIRDELERASLLGARYVVTHIGSSKEVGEKEGVKISSEMLTKCLEGYKGKARLLLENSAGAGSIIGDKFRELEEIISNVKNPGIAGICLDTQHSFASGYDWSDFRKTLQKIDQEIGLDKIKLLHLNDSLSDCGSNVDRHAHIGKGKIAQDSFLQLTRFAEEKKINAIVETKDPGVKDDIILLRQLRTQ
ncbi:deoxyribonuclease IV [Patescibacteria group bacterium]